ncbi:uncharacterized protein METZ01_LOCUS329860, partial [marine metagenome]
MIQGAVITIRTTLLKTYKLLTWPERTRGAFMLLGSMIASAIEVVALGSLLPLIAVLSNPNPSEVHPMIKYIFENLGSPSRIQFAIYCLGGVTILFLFKSVYLSIINFFLARYTWGLRERIGRDLINIYVSSDHQKHLSKNPIEMVTYLTNDTRGVTVVSGAFITLICDVAFLCAVVALLIRTDPLIAAGGMFLIVIGAGLFLKFILQKSRSWSQLALRG